MAQPTPSRAERLVIDLGRHRSKQRPLRLSDHREDGALGALSASDLAQSHGDPEPWNPMVFARHSVSVRPSRYLEWKLPFERALGLVLLALSLPMIVILVLLVCLTSPGPGIYRQRRVGRNGRVFSLYKIRSMRQDAEDATGPVWSSQQRDCRVTSVGRWLRTLHLDELPQLFNVARGEMTLIGPRPERPEFVELLHTKIPRYLDRLAVAPGITGLAQVTLPPDESLDGVEKKIDADVRYIRDASLSMDTRILGQTMLRLFRGDRLGSLIRTRPSAVPTRSGEGGESIQLRPEAPPV